MVRLRIPSFRYSAKGQRERSEKRKLYERQGNEPRTEGEGARTIRDRGGRARMDVGIKRNGTSRVIRVSWRNVRVQAAVDFGYTNFCSITFEFTHLF